MFSPISFFISSSSSSVFFLYWLSLIHRFIGKLPFLLSATLFCLSFNFPIFSAKQTRGEIDVIPSILCLIGFPSFRGTSQYSSSSLIFSFLYEGYSEYRGNISVVFIFLFRFCNGSSSQICLYVMSIEPNHRCIIIFIDAPIIDS